MKNTEIKPNEDVQVLVLKRNGDRHEVMRILTEAVIPFHFYNVHQFAVRLIDLDAVDKLLEGFEFEDEIDE